MAVLLAAPGPAAAADERQAPCFGGSSSGTLGSGPMGDYCWLVAAQVTTTSAKPVVYVAGNVVATDNSAPQQATTLMYLEGLVRCYDSGGRAVFVQGAGRNVWRGVGQAGNYPRGVLIPTVTGTYSCYTEVKKTTLANQAESALFVAGALGLTPATSGVSTPGPNGGTWNPDPSSQPAEEQVLAGGITEPQYGRLQWNGVVGATVNAVAMTNLSTCSFRSNRACPDNSTLPASVTVTFTAWQTKTDSTNPCGAAGSKNYKSVSQVVNLTSSIHHLGYNQAVGLEMDTSPACAARVVMRTSVANGGPSRIYIQTVNSAVSGWN